MDINKLIENARGEIWETVLLKSRDGFVPPGVIEWSPNKPPINHLEDGEQPHFISLNFDQAIKVRGDENCNIREKSRVPLNRVRKSIMHDDMVGSVSASDPYSTILLITNFRILLFVGQEDEDLKVEFRHSENVSISFENERTSNVATPAICVDDLKYEIEFWVSEESEAYAYLRDECPIDVGEHPKFGFDKTPERQVKGVNGVSSIQLSSILQLTPIEFEEYVANLWQAMNYSCYLTKGTRDGGVDVVADKGSDRTLIQAKRYTNTNVGIDTVQRTAGLLVDEEFDASSVVIVTTSGFTHDAKRRARQIKDLQLIDGEELVTLARRVNRGIGG